MIDHLYPFLFDVIIVLLLLVSVYQQHQTRAIVRQSTPVQLAAAVRSVQQQLEVGRGTSRPARGGSEMRRLMLFALLLFLAPVWAQSQGIKYTPPGLVSNGDGTWSTPGQAPLRTKAGAGTGTTLQTGILCANTTSQATTGTSEEILASCTIPANTLNANGMGLRVVAAGQTAANANSKTIRIRFGGLTGSQCSGVTATGNNVGWYATATVLRTGAATQVCSGDAGMSSTHAANFLASPTVDTTGATTVVVTGQTGTAAGDATFYLLTVEVLR